MLKLQGPQDGKSAADPARRAMAGGDDTVIAHNVLARPWQQDEKA